MRHLPGTVVLDVPVADRTPFATELARGVSAVHEPVADHEVAPVNTFRGVPLAEREVATREAIASLTSRRILRPDGRPVDAAEVTRCWESWSSAPAWDGPPVWVHGDLHAGNVLLDPVALIDFGDVTSGDPACDLAAAFLLFDAMSAVASSTTS